MSMIATYCKEISRELDHNVTPQTPLKELELVRENHELRAKLHVLERALEDLELDAFYTRDSLAQAQKNEALALYDRDQAQDAAASLDSALEKAVKRLIDTGRL